MKFDSKIYVSGHSGLVGSAIERSLISMGYKNIITSSRTEVDLTCQESTRSFFKKTEPEYVFVAAAMVGGIDANRTYPADFIYTNLMIQCNLIESSRIHGVKKIIFLGSSCIYPKFAKQPMREDELLKGELEETNIWYAIAKIAGIKLAQAYSLQHNMDIISAMPTNLYGPNDNYDLHTSHVLPALIRKFHEGKENNSKYVEVWGSGKPRREFLFVDDLAEGLIFLANNYSSNEPINIGFGEDCTIKELAEIIADVIGFKNEIIFKTSMPDGTPRKLLDSSKIKSLGWSPKVSLHEGIQISYKDFLKSYK